MYLNDYTREATELLRRFIAIPSPSGEEGAAASLMESVLRSYGFNPRREGNNVWVVDPNYDAHRPTLLLNAHLDTVKPVATWTRDPYAPTLEDIDSETARDEGGGDYRLYGLGSNDCGGALVAMLQAFRVLTAATDSVTAQVNLVYLASAEEENSGRDGIDRVLPLLPHIDAAIVGEPTDMQPAVAEKGLLVCDLIARGVSGHAARGEGVNAIYAALDDLQFIRAYSFPLVSRLLGETRMQVTMIKGGTQHNVVPDCCEMVLDVRPTDCYTNEAIYEFLSERLKSEVHARSFRLHSSGVPMDHPLVKCCLSLGMTPFGSPTLSNMALLPYDAIKLGPGDSARSHAADEYLLVSDIRRGIDVYVRLLNALAL